MKGLGKKGADKLLTFWWIFILMIVVIGIVSGISLASLKEVDVKKFEAEALTNKLERCLVTLGKLNPDFFESGFNIRKECGLNERSFPEKGASFFYKIILSDLKENKVVQISGGDLSMEEVCKVTEKSNVPKGYPQCFSRTEGVRYYTEEWNEGSLMISTGSNNQGRIK